MTTYFADTSALAKRYLPEIGSDWVQSWIIPTTGHTTVISALSAVEFVSLLSRRRREGNVSDEKFEWLHKVFLRHVEDQYRVIALTSPILEQARQLIISHPLRTLDAIQLASALAAAQIMQVTPVFVAADHRLLAAATAAGFTVENPLDHA